MACDITVAETIEKYTEDLQISTRLEDRRVACRALKLLAKDYRVEVCAQAMDSILAAIKTDRQDVELVNYCLDALNYIIAGPAAELPAAITSTSTTTTTSHTTTDDPAKELAEIFLKKTDNVATIMETIVDDDFKTRWISVRILCALARQKLVTLQQSILSIHSSIPKLVQLISDEHEILRNDALVLFVIISQSDKDIQNLAVFEDCFEKLMFIIEMENYLDGTVAVVMDCLNIILNLLQSNESNQIIFRERGFIKKLLPFFNKLHTIQWTNEISQCLMTILRIIDSMILITNSTLNVQESQKIMQRCGLLDKLCELLTVNAMPIAILSETINTASDIVRGHLGPNAFVVMPTSAMMPILLLSMVKEVCNVQETKIKELYNYAQKLHQYIVGSRE